MIGNCICSHAGQDALHGPGQRVFNARGGKNKDKAPRCTVCFDDLRAPVQQKAAENSKQKGKKKGKGKKDAK